MIGAKFARVAVSAAIFSIDHPYDYRIPPELINKVRVGMRVLVSFGRGNQKCEAMVLGISDTTDAKKVKSVIEVLDEEPILDERSMRLALWLREQCFCPLYDVFKSMLPSGVWYKIDIIYVPAKRATLDQAVETVGKMAHGEAVCHFLFAKPDGCTKKELEKEFGTINPSKIIRTLIDAEIINAISSATRNVGDKTIKLARLAVSAEEAAEYAKRKSKSAPMQRDILKLLIDMGSSSVKEICYFTGASGSTIRTLFRNGLIEFSEMEVFRRPNLNRRAPRQEIELNSDQNTAYDEIKMRLNDEKAGCALLYGVTGSGKTLIYMKLIEDVIANGRSAIMLVPEIALTPQLVDRFYSYFGDQIAILHSALTVGERFDEWKRIKSGVVNVVIGTRSAVFAPLNNIGIIIMDEEQEHTYKSGNNPRYHARNVAKFRCIQQNALLLLGSATPSVETMFQAKAGRYSLHTLPARYNDSAMPEVIISDMREELRAGNPSCIGAILRREIEKNLRRGEQTILFINRRGTSRYCVCEECGYVPECPRCSAALTFHSANERFMCHHCGSSQKITDICPQCGSSMKFVGAGTQKIEAELKEMYPDVEILRMDMDTTSGRLSHETLLNQFEQDKIPIMIGTQMITKGLDFENVTLVGVVDADQSLYVDDYRAAESTFSLITQVVGRAGRGEKSGRAVIQTFCPNHALITCAARQDYESFYESEINLRKIREFPPFRDIIGIMVSGMSENDALRGCLRIAASLEQARGSVYRDLDMKVYGPAPVAIVKVNNKYRYKLSICAASSKRMRYLIARLICDFRQDKQNRFLTIVADINPIDF